MSHCSYMVAHKCQPSSKDRAHHTDTTTTPHYISKRSVVSSHFDKSSVVWLWCRCGVPCLWTKVGICGPLYIYSYHFCTARQLALLKMYTMNQKISKASKIFHPTHRSTRPVDSGGSVLGQGGTGPPNLAQVPPPKKFFQVIQA